MKPIRDTMMLGYVCKTPACKERVVYLSCLADASLQPVCKDCKEDMERDPRKDFDNAIRIRKEV